MNSLDINLIFSGHGFGINTNILETNIVNLAVVIAVVISFVGEVIQNLLKDRRQSILKNIEEVNTRSLEVKEKMKKAVLKLQTAQEKALKIKKQGLIAAERERKAIKEQVRFVLD